MATSIFFLGRTISRSGSYSVVDASGLESVGLGAAGIVALIGEGEGGTPVTAINNGKDLQRVRGPEAARALYRAGDLREAGSMIFEPSSDPAILAGAQEVVFCKVNPATKSTGQLSNAFGPVIDLSSADYGAFTEQINVAVGAGSSAGKLITVIFEDVTETQDNVGGTELFTLQYTSAATTWGTMHTTVSGAGIVSSLGTRAQLGLDNEVTAWTAGPATAEIPANPNNAGRQVTLYGVDSLGAPAREVLTVSAGSTVVSTTVWTTVYGVIADQVATVSAIDINETGAGTGTIQIGVGQIERGARRGHGMFVANSVVSAEASGASSNTVQVWGRNAAQQIVGENIALFGAAGTPTNGTAVFSEIDAIVLGDAPAAQTITFKANAVVSDITVQTTLRKLGDLYNARNLVADVDGDGTAETTVGFDFTYVTGVLSTSPTALDEILAVDVEAPATGSFYANTQAIIDYLNTTSLVTAAQSAFTAQVDRITIDNVLNNTVYTISIDGTPIWYQSDANATDVEIQAGLIAAVNATPGINQKVVASAQAASTTGVDLTARIGSGGFTTAESDGNLTLTNVTTAAGAQVVPSNTSSPVFLSGGSEGLTTFTEWQKAFNLLKQVRVNSVVPLTGDPAVHAAADAHAQFMGGIGRSERDVFVGLSALDGNNSPTNVLPSKSSIKTQIVAINSRHTRAFAQNVERFNTAGERKTFLPWFQACLAAGMQAGSSVGTSLTFKYARVLSVDQDSSWSPIDDSEELIQAGLCFMENVEGVGRRFVRNVTTFLQSDNIAFTEGSVNEAVNFATFNFRTNLEIAVGAKGFAGTLNAAKSVALNTLGLLTDEGVITSFRSLLLSLVVDVLEVSVEMAPVIPINFVKSTIHLVTIPQTA